MNRILSIEELQSKFLLQIKSIFPYGTINLQFMKHHQPLIDLIVKEYYKDILLRLPHPINKVVYENMNNNLTLHDIYKYDRCNRMHSFSDIEDDVIRKELSWYEWIESKETE